MITKLIIKNYNPLMKKGVKTIVLETEEILNILLGRNGFGKTSLLKELTQFPPDNSDYGPGGYKEIHITINNDKYVLTSSTGKSSEHHFLFNGKEQNTGNTLLVQKELVKIHFGVTNNIKNILTGLNPKDLFTTLSAVRRKEVLMAINPNDTSFGLSVFDKLKSNHGSLKGALKNQRHRLVVEESRMKQLSSMDPTKLKEEMKTIDDQIKNALIVHGELSNSVHSEVTPIKDSIAKIISTLLSNSKLVTAPLSMLSEDMVNTQNNLLYYRNLEVKLQTSFEELSSQLSGVELGNNNLESYKGILALNQANIAEQEGKLQEIEKRLLGHELLLENDLYKNSDFILIIEDFISFIYGVQRTTDENITSQSYNEKKKKYTELTIEKENIERQIKDNVHLLDHFNQSEIVNCPKCENKFKIGFEKFDLEKTKLRQGSLIERKEILEKQITYLKDYLEENEGWLETMTGLVRFAQRTPFSKEIFQMIQFYRVGKSDGNSLVNGLRLVGKHNGLQKSITSLMTENEHVTKQITFLESSDVETLFKRSEYVERELASVQCGIQRCLNKIKVLTRQIDIIKADDCLREELSNQIAMLNDVLIENGKYQLKVKIENVINELTPKKDSIVEGLIRAESLNSVIESIKLNIAEMEKKEKHTQLLMDGLSPVKGLIGYLMNDFIKSVVGNVNAVIKPVWTNRLAVLNCSTSESEDDVDLNYSFPVLSGDSDIPNKDIGMCSGGEREIINFAFRLVLMRYLGDKCGIPLMMDEIGGMFDELHKGRFWGYVHEQLRLGKLPQVFMVSHSHKELTSAVNSANYIALNTEGLKVDFEVNKHSEIK